MSNASASPRRVSLVDLAVLAMLVTAAAIASQYGVRARMGPMVVSIGSVLLLTVHIILQFRGASLGIDQEEVLMSTEARRAAEESEAREEALARAGQQSIVVTQGGTLAGALAIVVAYPTLIILIGLVPAVFVFVFFFFLFISRLGLVRSLVFAAATEASIYGLFILTLGVRPNTGYLVDMLL